MKYIYKCVEECNPGKKIKVLIVFDDMIADVTSNKNFIQQSLSYLLGIGN